MMTNTNNPSNSSGSAATGSSNARVACEKLADQGRLLDLLNYVEDQAGSGLFHNCLPLVDRCIRARAADDVTQLADDLFARIIGLAGLLLIKSQLVVTHRLKECQKSGGYALSNLPQDLIDEGWMTRCENLARFIAEMTVTRSRVQHVNEINERSKRKEKNPIHSGDTVAADRSQNAKSPKRSRNGRFAASSSPVDDA